MRKLAASIALAIALAAPSYARDAHAADPSAADVESAQTLYKEGRALRERGELQPALQKLRAAYALVETPITALELGRTYVSLGLFVEAREVLQGVARIPVRKNESQRATEARTASDTLADELKPKLASLVVKPKGAAAGGPTKISVDGVPVPAEAAGLPRIVNPGKHVVVLEANGGQSRLEVELTPGQTREVAIDMPPPAATPRGPVDGNANANPQAGGRSPLVYVGFGTAVAGIAVGTITGLMTFSSASSVKDTCAEDGRCPSSAQSDIDSGATTGTIATVAFAVAGAGIVIGIVGLGLGRSKPANAARFDGRTATFVF